MPSFANTSIVVGATLCVLVVLSFYLSSPRPKPNHDMCEKYDKLVEQAQHWYAMSKQDTNIIAALVHVTAAMSKMNTLYTFLSSSEISHSVQHPDPDGLKRNIHLYQQKVLAGFMEMAPSIALPSDMMLDLDWFV